MMNDDSFPGHGGFSRDQEKVGEEKIPFIFVRNRTTGRGAINNICGLTNSMRTLFVIQSSSSVFFIRKNSQIQNMFFMSPSLVVGT
jgi:hypothetical protein